MMINHTLQLVAAYTMPTGASEFTILLAMLIAIIGPFAGTYMFMKNASKLFSAATGALSKVGKGAQKWAMGWAKERQGNSRFAQARAWNKSLKDAQRVERYGKTSGLQGVLNKGASVAAGGDLLNPKSWKDWQTNARKYQASAVNRAAINDDKIFKEDKDNAAAEFARNGIQGPLMVEHARAGRVVKDTGKKDADGKAIYEYGRKLTESEHSAAVEWAMSNAKLSERMDVYGADWATTPRNDSNRRALDTLNDGYFHVNKDVARFGNTFGGKMTAGVVGGDMGVNNAIFSNMTAGKTASEALIDNDMAQAAADLYSLDDTQLKAIVKKSGLLTREQTDAGWDEQKFVDEFRKNAEGVTGTILKNKDLRARVKPEFLGAITEMATSTRSATRATDATAKLAKLNDKEDRVNDKKPQQDLIIKESEYRTIQPAPKREL